MCWGCLCPPAHTDESVTLLTGIILAPAKVVSGGGNPWGAVLYSWGLVQVSLRPVPAPGPAGSPVALSSREVVHMSHTRR